MSYDVTVWEGERPPSNDKAGTVFDELYARYLESENLAVPPTARIKAYAEALVERYPEETADGPWVIPPVIDEASGPIIYLLMSYSRAGEVSEYAGQLARDHGLVCFDLQEEALLP